MKYKRIIHATLIFALAISITLALTPKSPSVALAETETEREARMEREYGDVGGKVAEAGNDACDWLADRFGPGACAEGEQEFSFIGFQGGLRAPTGAGLDESLKKAKDLRAFIKTALDLALSFLGIIAMAIIIYGGFLYVTAAGNEEQATKGKKSVMYAAIGIMIIMISFVLVEALVNFNPREADQRAASDDAGGTGGGTGGTAGTGGTVSQQIINNLGAVEINGLLNDFLGAYKNLVNITSLLDRVEQISISPTSSGKRAFLSEVKSIISDIKNKTNFLSQTNVAARELLDGWIAKKSALLAADPEDQGLEPETLKNELKEQLGISDTSTHASLGVPGKYMQANLLARASVQDRQAVENNLNDPARILDQQRDRQAEMVRNAGATIRGGQSQTGGASRTTSGNPPSSGDENQSYVPPPLPSITLNDAVKADFDAAINELIGTEEIKKPDTCQELKDTTDEKSKLWKLKEFLGGIACLQASAATKTAIEKGALTEKDLKILNEYSSSDTISDLFFNAYKALNDAHPLKDNPKQTNLVIDVIEALQRLFIVVKEIPFVQAKIVASAAVGNAPFTVELNGSDSRDPSGTTITDDRYSWDPDGDGVFDEIKDTNVECTDGNSKKAVITCDYKEPGTYMVGLKVKSSDENSVGEGQATLAIKVNPKLAKIQLSAEVDGSPLTKMPNGTTTEGIINNFHATTKEAKEKGIVFDATGSKDGKSKDLATYSWSFGDQTRPEQKERTEAHKYTRPGKYTVKLEVTDTGGRKDRAIVDVFIGPIAARIAPYPVIGEPDQLFEFDGGLSNSDNGSVTHAWTIFKLEEDPSDTETDPAKKRHIFQEKNDVQTVEVIGTKDKPVFRVKLKKPGTYKVGLKVTDSAGKFDEMETQPIAIKSKTPRANFTIRACPDDCPNPNMPARVDFDASMTFDPDEGDSEKLIYTWQFFTKNGTQLDKSSYEILNGDEKAKKISVKFNAPTDYKAKLKVEDPTQQEDIIEHAFKVNSIIEAAWGDIQSAVALQGGKAEFTFEGTAAHSTGVYIDYGDEYADDKAPENDKFSFTHTYTHAGSFLVTLKAKSDKDDSELTLKKRVFVTQGDAPLAVITVKVDNVEVVQTNDPGTGGPLQAPDLETINKKVIRFDASKSINSLGQGAGLEYTWNFGDGSPLRQGGAVSYSYSARSTGNSFYTATLTARETANPTKENQARFGVKIVSKKPLVNTLSLEKRTPSDTAPVDVDLTAEGATDPDGSISNYQFWYFNPLEKTKKLGVIDTPNNHAILRVETSGEEGAENEFLFCVSVTDNENMTSTCDELFEESELPHLKVKNGPNKAPIAAFTVDRSSILVGDSITFSSGSRDPDGRIKEYVWDFDGDGFQNDTPTEQARVPHTFERRSPVGGFKVKLKVIDNLNAAGFSEEMPITVAPKSSPPHAIFTATPDPSMTRRTRFTNASTADTEHGARIVKWKWDFDTAATYGCNVSDTVKPANCSGTTYDDVDSEEQNPLFTYPNSGMHTAQLTVEDSDGNVSDPTRVDVDNRAPSTSVIDQITGTSTGATGTTSSAITGSSTPITGTLRAELSAETTSGTRMRETPCNYITEDPDCKTKKTLEITGANGAEVVLSWKNSQGFTSIEIDENIYIRSADTGNRDQDKDYIYPDPSNPSNDGSCSAGQNCRIRTYHKSETKEDMPNRFRPRLTVIGPNGKDTDEVEIIFKDNALGGSLFTRLGRQNTILMGLVAGVLAVMLALGISSIMVKGKRRV